MSKVTITYYGVEGIGRNVTEAKKSAGARIEKMLSGDYTPEIISCRGQAVLVWRQPNGWDHRIIADGCTETGFRDGSVSGSGNFETREEALEAARIYLAQLTWTIQDGLTPPLTLSKESSRKFERWAEFQIRYQDAKSRGMSDWDCHSYAGKDPARPELWQHELAGQPY